MIPGAVAVFVVALIIIAVADHFGDPPENGGDMPLEDCFA